MGTSEPLLACGCNPSPGTAPGVTPRHRPLLVTGFTIAALWPMATMAAAMPSQPDLVVRAERDLRFGTMVVSDSASRTVHAAGDIVDGTMMPIGMGSAGPAQFTISYDRGKDDSHPIDIVLSIQLASLPPKALNGVVGTLSGFDTDLEGVDRLEPGHPASYTISQCTTRVCEVTFHVGARLDVTSGGSGGPLSISPPVTAVLMAVRR